SPVFFMAQCCGRTAGLRCRCSWQAQVAGNGQGGFGAVQGVEMQAGGALVEQVLAQAADDVFAECADGGFVVSEFGESKPYPSRHFSTTHVRESKQLGAVGNWHDARHDGHGDAAGANAVDEIEVGVGVEEVLGDGAVGAGLYFFDKVPEVGRSVAGLGRSEEHTSELQPRENLVCRLLLEKKNKQRFEVGKEKKPEIELALLSGCTDSRPP